MARMRPAGWRYESVRHSLAARGVPTGRRYNAWNWSKMSPDDAYTTKFLSWEGQGERLTAAGGAIKQGLRNTPLVGGIFGGPYEKIRLTESVGKALPGGQEGFAANLIESGVSQPAVTALWVAPGVGALAKTAQGTKLVTTAAGAPRALTPAWGALQDAKIAQTALLAPKTAFAARFAANTPAVIMGGGRTAAPYVGGVMTTSTALWPENVITGYQPGQSWGTGAKMYGELWKNKQFIAEHPKEIGAELWSATKQSFGKNTLTGSPSGFVVEPALTSAQMSPVVQNATTLPLKAPVAYVPKTQAYVPKTYSRDEWLQSMGVQ